MGEIDQHAERRLPSREDVARVYEAVLSHQMSREDADRWSGQWLPYERQIQVQDEVVLDGVLNLLGVDDRHGKDEPYLFSDDQIQVWFDEFKASCARS